MDKAIGAWFNRWRRTVQQAKQTNQLIRPSTEDDDKFGRLGAVCITNYWEANAGLARPLQVEKRHEYQWDAGVPLVGTIDQLRSVPLTYVEQQCPELIHDGNLREDHDQVVIIDLKTDFLSYDARDLGLERPALADTIRYQHDLHEDLAATVYTWLYFKTTGKLPVGFVWYHLRSNQTFFTYRGERDFFILRDVIDHVLGNLGVQSFPKHPGRHCRWCDYQEPCREGRSLLVSQPCRILGDSAPVWCAPTAEKPISRQLTLGLRVPRTKRL